MHAEAGSTAGNVLSNLRQYQHPFSPKKKKNKNAGHTEAPGCHVPLGYLLQKDPIWAWALYY